MLPNFAVALDGRHNAYMLGVRANAIFRINSSTTTLETSTVTENPTLLVCEPRSGYLFMANGTKIWTFSPTCHHRLLVDLSADNYHIQYLAVVSDDCFAESTHAALISILGHWPLGLLPIVGDYTRFGVYLVVADDKRNRILRVDVGFLPV
jgi:hypothetical protein